MIGIKSPRSRYKPGDILQVYFPFEDTEDEKGRPALVWADQDDSLIVSKITSKIKGREWDVPISPDSHNGLFCESVVQVDRTIKLSQEKICDVIPLGCLNALQLHIVHEKFKAYRESIK